MSGLFQVTSNTDASQWMKVRARCLSCARDIAARNAGAEGTLLWRDPQQSSVVVVHEPVRSDAKPGLVARSEALRGY